MIKIPPTIWFLIGSAALSVPSFAQDAALQEVVVTAQRRAQSAQDVPISMTVLSSQAIREDHITTPADLASQTPGLIANGSIGSSNPIFTIRGIGLNDVFSNNNPDTSLYVDGVLLPFSPMLSFDLFDLQRVEVLEGPQGTLYGRNTTGGAINFITNKPTADTEGYAQVDYGNYQHTEFEGALGGRLTDTLLGRISIKTVQQNGGWQTNELTGKQIGARDDIAARGQLLWQPDENTSALLSFDWATNKDDNELRTHVGSYSSPFSFTPCPAESQLGGRDEGPCVDFLGYYDPSKNPRVVANSSIYGDRDDGVSDGAALTVTHTFSAFTLTSVTGYHYFTRKLGDDSDGGALIELDSLFTDHIHSITQELRLASLDSSYLHWVAGLYASDDSIHGDILQALDQNLFNTRVDTDWLQTTRSYAGFGQVEWPLTSRWHLTAGARYTNESKGIVYNSHDLNPYGDSTLPTPLAGIHNTTTANNLSGKLELDYHLTDATMFYGSVSKGFKSGGFKAAIAFSPAELAPFKPETVYAYELGVKSTIPDAHLRFNGAVYYYDWRNFQAYITEDDAGINVVVLGNAGNARIKGAEAQVIWAPLQGLEFTVGTNWLQTEIVKWNSAPGTADDAGNQLANAPKNSLNGTIRYAFPLGQSGLQLYVLGNANYEGAQFFAVSNNPQAYQAGYTLFNGRFGLQNGHWDVSAWGQNLGNKLYISQAYDNYPGIFPSSWFYAPPRTYGVSVRYDF